MEKAMRGGETGRVCGPLSAARSGCQRGQRRGKSLKYRPLCTCEAETVSGADCVVVEAVIGEPVSRSEQGIFAVWSQKQGACGHEIGDAQKLARNYRSLSQSKPTFLLFS